MANLNRVFLIGNLTRDPELRYTPGGMAIASFGIAVNTPMGKDESGNLKTETLFIDVVAFGKQAETLAEYMKKGRLILVEGRLRYRTWEDANGNKRSKHEVILSSFQFLSSKSKTEDAFDDTAAPAEDEDIPF